jgi:hypothetical protein
MKAHSDTQPQTLQNQNNGSWLYNYNIEQVIISDQMTSAEQTSYKCDQVTIWGEPTKRKLKKAIIESEHEGDAEKQLINDYLAFQAGILTDQASHDNYITFLNRRREIKDMINTDESIAILS